MKQIFYQKPGKILFRDDVIIPSVQSQDDIKIKIAYCGVCSGNIYRAKGFMDHWDTETIVPMGHEPSGYITELGPEAAKLGFKVGDKVIFNVVFYCGCCRYCREGRSNLCLNPNSPEIAMAEYAVLPAKQVFKVDDDANMQQVPFIEPLSVCLHGFKKLDIQPGSFVAISGGGALGQLMMQLAKKAGASKVTMIDPLVQKQEIALKCGADFVLNPNTQNILDEAKKITDGYLYDVVVECSGNPKAVKVAYDIAGFGATIEFISIYPIGSTLEGIDLHTNFLGKKDIKIVTSFQNPFCWEQAVKVFKELIIEPLTLKVFKPEDIEEAMAAQERGECIRSLIQFSE